MAQVGRLEWITPKAYSLPFNFRLFSVGVATLLSLFVKPRIKLAVLELLADFICPECFTGWRFNFVRSYSLKSSIFQTKV